MPLTTAQQIVFDHILNMTEPGNVANLTAQGGAGKSFVIAAVATSKAQRAESITILSPTHAALIQLRDKIDLAPELLQYVKFQTVASALNIIPNFSNTSVEVGFMRLGNRAIDGLVIVDESSMLGEYEVKLLKKVCSEGQLVFSGDNAQLAPVNKKSGNELLQMFAQLTLVDNMRSGNVLAAIALEARNTAYYSPLPDNEYCFNYNTVEELQEAFLAKVVATKIGNVVYICRTNTEAQDLNQRAAIALELAEIPCTTYRLYKNTELGHNNQVIELNLVINESNKYGYRCTAKSGRKYEVCLPSQYTRVTKAIESIVVQFQNNTGNDLLADELEYLREIVPIDFPFAMTTHKSQGASIPIVFVNNFSIHGTKAKYVAYSRPQQELHLIKQVATKPCLGWANKSGTKLASEPYDIAAIQKEIEVLGFDSPSKSHLQCVLNPQHAAKSAKGWKALY